MHANRQLHGIAEVMARYRAGRMSRRRALGLLTGFGLTATGAAALLGRGGGEASAGGHAGHAGHARFGHHQEASGSPGPEAPPATPVLGEQPDGTRVWRVQVAAFDQANGAEAMAFFPEEITIAAGDSIFFDNQGFHTVSFLSGAPVPPLAVPPTGPGTPTAAPAAGQPAVLLNPAVVFPAGGDTYDGTGYVNSGVPLDPSAPPFVLTFTTPGSFDYLCLVHSTVMKGKITVQDAGTAPSLDQTAIDQQIAEQSAAILGQAADLIARYSAATPAAGASGAAIHEVAAGVGEGKLEIYQFVPDTLTVKAGDTVRWTYRGIQDPHTVTFLGGSEPPEDLIVVPQDAGPPIFGINAATFLPAGEAVYHGQGYANSGYLWPDDPSDERLAGLGMTLPNTYELTFDTAGDQPYYCVIHGDPVARQGMVGTITVG
jgi:plastocyanin